PCDLIAFLVLSFLKISGLGPLISQPSRLKNWKPAILPPISLRTAMQPPCASACSTRCSSREISIEDLKPEQAGPATREQTWSPHRLAGDVRVIHGPSRLDGVSGNLRLTRHGANYMPEPAGPPDRVGGAVEISSEPVQTSNITTEDRT